MFLGEENRIVLPQIHITYRRKSLANIFEAPEMIKHGAILCAT